MFIIFKIWPYSANVDREKNEKSVPSLRHCTALRMGKSEGDCSGSLRFLLQHLLLQHECVDRSTLNNTKQYVATRPNRMLPPVTAECCYLSQQNVAICQNRMLHSVTIDCCHFSQQNVATRHNRMLPRVTIECFHLSKQNVALCHNRLLLLFTTECYHRTQENVATFHNRILLPDTTECYHFITIQLPRSLLRSGNYCLT